MKMFKKLTGIILSLGLMCMAAVNLTGCTGSTYLDVSIGGVTVDIDDTVQSLYDNGLCFCEIMGGNIKNLEDLDAIPAKTYVIDNYAIGVPKDESSAEYSGVVAAIYNDSSLSKPVAECKIYKLTFLSVEDEVEVTIGGQDIFHMEPQEAYDACNAMGIDFASKNKDRLDDFLAGDGYLLSSQGTLSYKLKASTTDGELSYDFEYRKDIN